MTDATDPDAHLRALAATTPDVLITIDSEHRIQYVNPSIEAMLGYSPAELRGTSLATILPAAFVERHRAAVDRSPEPERRASRDHVELRGQHADGHEVPLRISLGEFTHTVAVRDGAVILSAE